MNGWIGRGWLSVGLVLCALGCQQGGQLPSRVALLAEHGQYEEAIDTLEKQLAEQGSSVEPLRYLMRLYATEGNWAKVEVTFSKLQEASPSGSPEPWLELGHAYELVHDFDQALIAYDRASGVAPEDPRGPEIGGRRAARWGQWAKAQIRLNEALSRNPKDAELWHSLGFVLLAQGEVEQAERAYRRGLTLAPELLSNRVGLASVALRKGDNAAALGHYEALIRARPRYADAYLGRSWALLQLGRYSEVGRVLDAALKQGADADIVSSQRTLLTASWSEASVDQ